MWQMIHSQPDMAYLLVWTCSAAGRGHRCVTQLLRVVGAGTAPIAAEAAENDAAIQRYRLVYQNRSITSSDTTTCIALQMSGKHVSTKPPESPAVGAANIGRHNSHASASVHALC